MSRSELSPQGNFTPPAENYHYCSYVLDGASTQMTVLTALAMAHEQFSPVQNAVMATEINNLVPETSIQDFMASRFTFGLRQSLLSSSLVPVGYRCSDISEFRSRIIALHEPNTLPFSGDCMNSSTTIELALSNLQRFKADQFLTHANVSISTYQMYFTYEEGQPVPRQPFYNHLSHMFPLIRTADQIVTVDTSDFYGNLIHTLLLPLITTGKHPLNRVPPLGFIPATTVPLATTEPFICGGAKPYQEFQNPDHSITLANFRLFPHNGQYSAQVELINQPADLTQDQPMSALTAFISPEQKPIFFAGGYRIYFDHGITPVLVNGIHPQPVTPDHISETTLPINVLDTKETILYSSAFVNQLTQVVSEFQNIILPKLN